MGRPTLVFFAMPYGTRLNGADGPSYNFDKVYEILDATLRAKGMRPERLDGLYGPTAVIDLVSRSIQRAEVVVVDFTTKNSKSRLFGRMTLANDDSQCEDGPGSHSRPSSSMMAQAIACTVGNSNLLLGAG